jgi:gluconate 2-dehydrogenase gamma chain
MGLGNPLRPGGRWTLSRRELLKRAGVLAAAATVPLEWGLRVARAARSAAGTKVPTPPAGTAGALTATQLVALSAIAARIVPTDAIGPGATEAGAAQYINLSLAGYPNIRDSLAATFVGTSVSTYLPAYQAGLAAVDAYAQSTQGAVFAQLGSAQQDAILTAMQAGTATGFTGGSATFFTTVRTHVLQGMLCDPYYGGNIDFVGWKWVGYPGVRMPVAAGDQTMTAPALNPISAYGLATYHSGPPKLKG